MKSIERLEDKSVYKQLVLIQLVYGLMNQLRLDSALLSVCLVSSICTLQVS